MLDRVQDTVAPHIGRTRELCASALAPHRGSDLATGARREYLMAICDGREDEMDDMCRTAQRVIIGVTGGENRNIEHATRASEMVLAGLNVQLGAVSSLPYRPLNA